MFRRFHHVLAMLVLSMSSTALKASQLEFDTVALTGQRAVSDDFDAYYVAFYAMAISDDGQLTFTGLMEGDDVRYPDERYGVWAGSADGVSNVMRGSTNAPGVDGYIKHNAVARINANGELVVDANLNAEVGQGRDHVIWTGLPNSLQVSAREGDHAPGTAPDTVFGGPEVPGIASNFHSIRLSDAGDLSFVTIIRGSDVTGMEEGFWFGTPGNVELVARTNMQAVGLPEDIKYTGLGEPANRNGKAAFFASLTGSSEHSPNHGIWLGTPGDIQVVAATGEEADGVAGAKFSQLGYSNSVHIDEQSRVLFAASIVGPGINGTNDFGYWLGDANGTNPIFRTGQSIPGTGGAIATGIGVEPGADGEYTVFATLGGDSVTVENDTAWLLGPPDALRLIVREGMQAPGTSDGATIGELFYTSAGTPTTPDGRMAFFTLLRGDSVTSENDEALYLSEPEGLLQLVAREGELFDVGGGDFRMISTLDLVAGQSDTSLNSQGQLFFRADFADGSSGIFVARSVPEPSSIALLALGAAGITLLGFRTMRNSP